MLMIFEEKNERKKMIELLEKLNAEEKVMGLKINEEDIKMMSLEKKFKKLQIFWLGKYVFDEMI